MKRFEFIEHTADIAIKAYGDSLGSAFAAAAEAMFDIITDSAEIRPVNRTELRVESDSLESLLVKMLSDLIVVHEVERIVLTDFKVTLTGKFAAQVSAWGEPFDPERHAQGQHVKGVSYHMMEIHEGGSDEESFVQVLFDV